MSGVCGGGGAMSDCTPVLNAGTDISGPLVLASASLSPTLPDLPPLPPLSAPRPAPGLALQTAQVLLPHYLNALHCAKPFLLHALQLFNHSISCCNSASSPSSTSASSAFSLFFTSCSGAHSSCTAALTLSRLWCDRVHRIRRRVEGVRWRARGAVPPKQACRHCARRLSSLLLLVLSL